MAFAKIRGPIGGSRQDFYTSFLAMHLRAQMSDKPVSLDDVAMPWAPPPEPEEDDEDPEL
jgi:hypothetical protein